MVVDVVMAYEIIMVTTATATVRCSAGRLAGRFLGGGGDGGRRLIAPRFYEGSEEGARRLTPLRYFPVGGMKRIIAPLDIIPLAQYSGRR